MIIGEKRYKKIKTSKYKKKTGKPLNLHVALNF